MADGVVLGLGDGINEGLGEGKCVVGDVDGLDVGNRDGSADNGVGSTVVGSRDGLGVGLVDGMELGEGVGIIVGDGVVGEGVIKFVGD